MKKLMFIALAAAAFTFSSCGTGNDNGGTENPGNDQELLDNGNNTEAPTDSTTEVANDEQTEAPAEEAPAEEAPAEEAPAAEAN